MTENKQGERVVEAQIEIDAPASVVWRALTDAEELTRWFPLHARVEPGEGGSIWLSWEELYEGESRIRIWEPNRHLRTGYVPGEPGQARAGEGERPGSLELMIDYHIEARGGRTILRVVHSGFGREGEWDDEYEGVRRGWAYELRSLRHYLERHRGENRRVAWALRNVDTAEEVAWARVMSADGLLAEGDIEGLAEGDGYAIQTATGRNLEGEVFINDPPLDFSGSVTNLNDGIFRFGLEHGKSGRSAILWLGTYGLPAQEVEQLSEELGRVLNSTEQ